MQGTLCDDIKGNKHDRVLIFFFYLLQTQLDESQIDAAFKKLFRQLAGPVSAFLSLQEINETLDKHLTVFYLSLTGHGDQHHRAANHPEQDHQQT